MADCRACGAPILWADVGPERIPLENGASFEGPDRYRVVEFGQPNKAAKVRDDYGMEAHLDHRKVCPALTTSVR